MKKIVFVTLILLALFSFSISYGAENTLMQKELSKCYYIVGTEKYFASSVKTITLLNNNVVPNDAIDSWDVSEDNNGDVIAWIKNSSNNGYDLYIGGNGKFYASQDSSFLFSYYSSCTKIYGLDYLDTSKVQNMKGMFYFCEELNNLDLSSFDTSKVTDMSRMFDCCNKLTSIDLSNFNTSQVTNMERMFEYCEKLTNLDLSNFETSEVTDMNSMFNECSEIENLDLSGFDTKNVTSMWQMFMYCGNLKSINLSSFETNKLTDMGSMFRYCGNLNELDLSNFNTNNVTSMSCIFDGCSNLTILDISNFDLSGIGSISGDSSYFTSNMFGNCYNLDKILYLRNIDLDEEISTFWGVESSLDTINPTLYVNDNSVRNMLIANEDYYEMFGEDRIVVYNTTLSDNIIVERNDTNYIIGSTKYKSDRVKTITLLNTNIVPDDTIDSWDVSKNNDGSVMAWIKISSYKESFEEYGNSNISGSGEELYGNNISESNDYIEMEYYDLFIGGNGTIYAPSNSERLFSYVNCIQINGLEYLDTSTVTDMEMMFSDCESLNSIDITYFNTSNVTNMSYMFAGCNNLASIDLSTFDTSNVTNMLSMFAYCGNLESVDLSGFDTSNVIYMVDMFCGCSNLKSLILSAFDTSSVEDMRSMFECCSNLENIDLSEFNTSNVTDMTRMFSGCYNLESIDLSKFETSNVTNMAGMFYGCSGLKSIEITNFETSNVIFMADMFGSCRNLKNINLSKFDTSNVTDMSNMFYNCSSLTKLDLSGFDTSSVENMTGMFAMCEQLEELDLTGFNTINCLYMEDLFQETTNLEKIMYLDDINKNEDVLLVFGEDTRLDTIEPTLFVKNSIAKSILDENEQYVSLFGKDRIVALDSSAVIKPLLNDKYEYEYNGTEIELNIEIDNEYTAISGETKATEIGTYTAIISLKDTDNYTWSDGSVAPIEVVWSIIPVKVTKPNLEEAYSYTYNGNEKQLSVVIDNETMQLSGDKVATNVGIYNASVELKDVDHYIWSDDSIAPIEVVWSITPAKVSKPELDEEYNYTYNGNEKQLSVVIDDEIMQLSGDKVATNVGIYTATIELKDTKNYTWSDDTINPIEIAWVITPAKVTKPELAENYSCTYTGTEKELCIEIDTETMQISGTTKATNVGEYTAYISLKDSDNYMWDDNTVEPIEVTWSIVSPIEIEKPLLNDKYEFEYNGTEKEINIEIDNENVTMSGETKATVVGTYTAIISLKDSDHYTWSDGSVAPIEVEWSITPVKVTKPELDEAYNYIYTGNEKQLSVTIDDETMQLSGDKVATNVGEYTAYIMLKDSDNYMWADNTVEPIEVTWSIVSPIEIEKPLLSDKYEFEYNGTEKEINIEIDDENVTMSGETKATEVGTYTAIISLKDSDHYTWSDGSVAPIEVEWSITPAKVTKPELNEAYNYTYTGNEKQLSVTIDDETMQLSGEKFATNVGNYTAIIELKDTNNYTWVDGSITPIEVVWGIIPVKVTKPELDENYSYTYTGIEKELCIEIDNETMQISGTTKATNVGEYTAYISLKDSDNYMWTDNSNDSLEINWAIIPSKITSIRIYDSYLYDYDNNYQSYNQSKEYDGTEKSINIAIDDDLVYLSGDVKATNVGNYKLKIALKDPTNYMWSNGSNKPLEINWIIQGQVVYIPWYFNQIHEQQYTGNVQEYNRSISSTAEYYVIESDKETNIGGPYHAKIALKNPESHVWENSNNSNEPIDIEWCITKVQVKVPKQYNCYYNGYEQKFDFRYYDSNRMIITSNVTSARDAGSYPVTFALKEPDKFEWEIYNDADDTYIYSSEPITIDCIINKKSIYLADYDYNYRDTTILPKLINYTGEPINYGQTKEYQKACIDENTGKQIYKYVDGDTATGVGGDYKAKVKLLDAQNYQFLKLNIYTNKYESVTEGEIDWTVAYKEIAFKAPADGIVREYNGKEQVVTIDDYSDISLIKKLINEGKITISDNKATDEGYYRLTLSVVNNDELGMIYVYDNKTGELMNYGYTVRLRWIIEKKVTPISLKVSVNGSVLTEENTRQISDGEKIRIDASHDSGIETIYYRIGNESQNSSSNSSISIDIPSKYYNNGTIKLMVRAIAKDGTRTDYLYYNLNPKSANYPSIKVVADGKNISSNSDVTVGDKAKVTITASSSKGIKKLLYQVGNEKQKSVTKSSTSFTLDKKYTNNGNVLIKVKVVGKDGTETNWYRYYLYPEKPVTPPSIKLVVDGKTAIQGKVLEVADKAKLTITASHSSGIKKLYYQVGSEKQKTASKATATVTLDKKYTNKGELIIKVKAQNKDGDESDWVTYILKPMKVYTPPTFKLTVDGKTATQNETLEVGDKAKLTITASHPSGIKKLYYQVGSEKQKTASKATATATLDTKYTNKGEVTIKVKAQTKDGDESEWVTYKLKPTKIYVAPTFSLEAGGKIASPNTALKVGDKAKIKITAKHSSGIKKIYYQIGTEKQKTASKATATATLNKKYTNQGEITIKVKVEAKDGAMSDWVTYKVNPTK